MYFFTVTENPTAVCNLLGYQRAWLHPKKFSILNAFRPLLFVLRKTSYAHLNSHQPYPNLVMWNSAFGKQGKCNWQARLTSIIEIHFEFRQGQFHFKAVIFASNSYILLCFYGSIKFSTKCKYDFNKSPNDFLIWFS